MLRIIEREVANSDASSLNYFDVASAGFAKAIAIVLFWISGSQGTNLMRYDRGFCLCAAHDSGLCAVVSSSLSSVTGRVGALPSF